MTKAIRTAQPSRSACLLAAVLFVLAACGDGDSSKVAGSGAQAPAAVSGYVGPLGPVSEPDAKLFDAVGRGDLDAITQAIEAGANVNAADKLKRTPLFAAAFLNRAKAASLLIAHGADVNVDDANGHSPIHAAVIMGGKDVAEVLIANGARIDDHTLAGRTPLHLAAATNQQAMVELLLAKGAKAQVKDSEGLTPAALAARNGHKEVSEEIRRWIDAHRHK